ncbi:MAG: hypothetical protein WCS27_05385, partial [Victivallaceae bacterium]
MIDSHVHIKEKLVKINDFRKKMYRTKEKGAVILSLPPATFFSAGQKYPFVQRLNNILEWCKDEKDFYPFF